jgi:hypothetical protein
LLTYSEDFTNAAWTKADATILANQIIAPDGALTMDKLVEDATSAEHLFSVNATAANQTFSIFAKAAERSIVTIAVSTSATNYGAARFNLSDGTFVTNLGTGGGVTVAVTNVGNGIYRCSVLWAGVISGAAIAVSLATDMVTFGPRGRQTYTGDGVSGIYIWGAQLEAGAFATPYTPTVAAQVTRLADSAVMTGVNFSSWFNPSEGSFFSEALYNGIGNYVLFAKTANYPTDNAFIRTLANGNFAILVSGVAQANMTPTAPTTNTFAKVAGTYKTNDFAVSLNGATPVTDTSGITPNTLASLEIGSSANTSHINSYIKRITYYNRRLSSAELQAITR